MKSLYYKILVEEFREKLILATINSKYIKENLSFLEHVELCNYVLKMTDEEILENFLSEQVRDIESRWEKFKSYSIDALIGLIFKQKISTSLIFSFIFRKIMDPCWRKCLSKFGRPTQRKLCKEECVVDSLRQIVSELRASLAKCNSMPDPADCQRKLQKEYIKYAKMLQDHTVKMRKAQMRLQNKALKQKRREIVMRATTAESKDLKKKEMLQFITESKVLRKKLTFAQHLKLYNKVRNL